MALAKDFRVCIKCHIKKLKTEFPLTFKDSPKCGRRWTCVECGGISINGFRVKTFTSSKEDRFKYVQESKNKPCTDCGGTFPLECMDFDHIPERGEKEFNICWSYARQDIENLKLEIDKCEVVCANCHRIRTKQRRKNKKNYE